MDKMRNSSLIVPLEPSPRLGPVNHFFKPYEDALMMELRQQVNQVIVPFPIRLNQKQNNIPTKITKEYKMIPEIPKCIVSPKPMIKPYPLEYSQSIKEEFLISKMKVGEWSDEEHEQFLKGYQKYNRNWSYIARDFVKSRTRQQVRNHAVKYFEKKQ